MPGAASGSEASFFQIPGNIKQSLVPFQIKGYSDINSKKTNSTELAGAEPQFFTFRPDRATRKGSLLNICPSSFSQAITDDISYKLLYRKASSVNVMLPQSVNAMSIFESIPGIQIREFLPDTALNQLVNFITTMMETVDALKTSTKEKKSDTATQGTAQNVNDGQKQEKGNFITRLFNAAKWIIGYMTCGVTPNFLTPVEGVLKSVGAAKWYGNADEKLQHYIMNFPYAMYFRFLGCVTTNIYEVPCALPGNVLYTSDGAPGWDAGGIDLLFGPLANMDLVKTLFGNVRVHYMKTWDAKEGSSTPGEAIQVTFDLFNDTAEAAVNNFMFVNTLIANNKWIQYNVFEHAPSLYDIKIEGCNRLFACTGAFKVSYKGILREPSSNMMSELFKFKNSNVSADEFVFMSNQIIKIPDVYTVEMTFNSVLPQNFNTWLFQYSNNMSLWNDPAAKKAYQASIVTDILSKSIETFVTEFKKNW